MQLAWNFRPAPRVVVMHVVTGMHQDGRVVCGRCGLLLVKLPGEAMYQKADCGFIGAAVWIKPGVVYHYGRGIVSDRCPGGRFTVQCYAKDPAGVLADGRELKGKKATYVSGRVS